MVDEKCTDSRYASRSFPPPSLYLIIISRSMPSIVLIDNPVPSATVPSQTISEATHFPIFLNNQSLPVLFEIGKNGPDCPPRNTSPIPPSSSDRLCISLNGTSQINFIFRSCMSASRWSERRATASSPGISRWAM